MVNKNVGPLTIENARIIFRNFEGRTSKYNPGGVRGFSVVLEDQDLIDKLVRDGWNVKQRPPREEGDEPLYHLPVTVSYLYRPPIITMISAVSGTRVMLDEEDVKMVDWIEIKNADLIINPSFWDVQGKQGIKAYLKKLYVIREEDELDLKYADTDADFYDEDEPDDESL